MLSTTCWVITKGFDQIEEKVYLFKEDAERGLDVLRGHPSWSQYPASMFHVRMRVLVLAFGVTDQRVPPEALITPWTPGA